MCLKTQYEYESSIQVSLMPSRWWALKLALNLCSELNTNTGRLPSPHCTAEHSPHLHLQRFQNRCTGLFSPSFSSYTSCEPHTAWRTSARAANTIKIWNILLTAALNSQLILWSIFDVHFFYLFQSPFFLSLRLRPSWDTNVECDKNSLYKKTNKKKKCWGCILRNVLNSLTIGNRMDEKKESFSLYFLSVVHSGHFGCQVSFIHARFGVKLNHCRVVLIRMRLIASLCCSWCFQQLVCDCTVLYYWLYSLWLAGQWENCY